MTFGEKLQYLRKTRGLSQEQLAAQVTVSRQAVSKWELDAAMPDTENILQISRLFGVTTDFLLDNTLDVETGVEDGMMDNKSIIYKPIAFIILTFCITWACAFFMAYQTWLDNSTFFGTAVLMSVDFLESASPLLAAIILLRKALFKEQMLFKFAFGDKPKLLPYMAVVLLFIYQFFTFYFFRIQEGNSIGLISFLGAFTGQVLLGGGMEEGGWRAYLQPALEKKIHPILGVLCVSLVWACWHLPYFFLPDTLQSGSNFLFYLITTTATAFTLTAIYKMTGSVLLCTLFHGWQNAIVMSLSTDMGHPGFLLMFGIQTAVSVILCIKPIGAHASEAVKLTS